MDTRTYLILKKELENNSYSAYGENGIDKLFKIYCENEIQKYDDLFKSHKDFSHFVKDNLSLFHSDPGEDDEDFKREILGATHHKYVKLFLFKSNMHNARRNEEEWVGTIEKIIGQTRPKILEVGAGSIPFSSIMLARDLNKISSMDNFDLSEKNLRNLQVDPHDEYFTNQTNINAYDFIIGKKPCSAIKPIVGKHKKPYFLMLCECESPNFDLESWQPYLRVLDRNIKFSRDNKYAYNLDDNFNDADEILEK